MATETGGTDWGSLITLLAGVVGGLSSGQSLTGKPQQQGANTGPLTAEGQRIMDEYTRTLDQTPMTTTNRMGNVSVTLPNKSRLGILKNMAALELIRKGNLTQQSAEEGILGKLAPLLAAMTKKKKDPNDPYNLGTTTPNTNYNAGTVGYDPNYKPENDWMADIWRYGSEGE